VYLAVHDIVQRVIDLPMALDEAVALKGIGYDLDNKVARTAGAGVSGVLGAFVDYVERLG
jgi:hypothetical protein